MVAYHKTLAEGQWQKLTLMEQLGNVGSEVSRAELWRGRDRHLYEQARDRALELLDLTIQDARAPATLRELTRAREVLCDAFLGGKEYGSSLDDLNQYFFHFALAARASIRLAK